MCSPDQATRRRPLYRTCALAVVAAIVLVSCQSAGSKATLAERVAKYWELKQSKAWEQIYDGFVDPEAKARLRREAFLKKRELAFDILSYQVGPLPTEGEKAIVSVENEVNFPLRAPDGAMRLIKKSVTTTETWVRRDGAWFVQVEK